MKISSYLFTAILVLLFAFPCAAEQKIRVAVMQFSAAGGHAGQLGKATEGWFVDSLVETRKFKVMERAQMDALLREHRFQKSGDVSAATAVKAGKLAGVQVVVFGTVQFAQKSQQVHTSGWVPGAPIRLPSGRGAKRTSEGNLTARAVDVQTGEILFSKSETLSESNFSFDVMGSGAGTSWDETVFRKIYQPAVEKITREMVAKIENLREGVGAGASGEGKVVSLKKGTVFINLGKLDGVRPGDEYDIFQAEVITDPDTKEVLGRDERQVGRVAVEKLSGDHLSTTRIVSGGDFAVGNIVKKK